MLKHRHNFFSNQLLRVLATYLRSQSCSLQFIEYLIPQVAQSLGRDTSPSSVMEVLAAVAYAKHPQLEGTIQLAMSPFVENIVQNLNRFKAPQHLSLLLLQMKSNRIGNKIFYEVLSVEFIRHIEKFSLEQKTSILECLSWSDIEASNVVRSAHAVVASTLEAFLLSFHQDGKIQIPDGLFSEAQMKYIKAAAHDINLFKESYNEQYETI